jgi:outer membrane lipoprotein-sorting protein
MRTLSALLFALALSISGPAQSPATRSQNTYTVDQALAKMDEVGKSFRSMQASIERTKVTVLVNDKVVDSGKVYFERRGQESRIRLRIERPEPQEMLIDNGKILIYYPKIKQAQEHVLGKDQNKAEFLLIGFGQSNQDIKKLYDITQQDDEVINGQKTTVLDLKPKSTQFSALFTTIRLWMDQQRWIPLQTRTTEASGDYMIVKFTDIKMNANIPDSIFSLKLPKDVTPSPI